MEIRGLYELFAQHVYGGIGEYHWDAELSKTSSGLWDILSMIFVKELSMSTKYTVRENNHSLGIISLQKDFNYWMIRDAFRKEGIWDGHCDVYELAPEGNGFELTLNDRQFQLDEK